MWHSYRELQPAICFWNPSISNETLAIKMAHCSRFQKKNYPFFCKNWTLWESNLKRIESSILSDPIMTQISLLCNFCFRHVQAKHLVLFCTQKECGRIHLCKENSIDSFGSFLAARSFERFLGIFEIDYTYIYNLQKHCVNVRLDHFIFA